MILYKKQANNIIKKLKAIPRARESRKPPGEGTTPLRGTRSGSRHRSRCEPGIRGFRAVRTAGRSISFGQSP